MDPTKRDNVVTWGRFLELCARFDHSFSEVRFFLPTVSYGALAGKIFRALGAILLSKDVEEPSLRRHPKNVFVCVDLLNFSGAFCVKL